MKKTAPKKKPLKGQILQYMFCLGMVSLAFVFSLFAIATLGFAVEVAITPFHLIAALVLTALASVFLSWYYYGDKKTIDWKPVAGMLAGFGIILLACWAMAHSVYDISFDGQWYHEGGVYQLANGYNPIYGQVPDSYSGSEFINDYPKTLEISSAVIYAFTHGIEDGKLLNPFLIVMSFLLILPAIAYAFPDLDIRYAAVIAALAALNPVCIYQSLSYYVDGASASLLAVLVFLLILAFKKMDYVIYGAITFTIILAINFKFFDLVYVGIIVVGYVLICYLYRVARPLHYLLIASVVVAILFGFNPYITNFLGHGTPFYPIEGISTSMIMGDTPPNLLGQNQVEQFVYSIFSESSVQKVDARLRVPFAINNSEYMAFSQTDPRVGGFGELFSAVFILMIVVAGILVYMNVRERTPLSTFILLMCLLILASVLINPASWWARYVPQFWLIAPLLLLCSSERFTGNLKLLNYALIALIALNVLIVAYTYYTYQPFATSLLNKQLVQIKPYADNSPVKLSPGIFMTTQQRFSEYGIRYVLDDNLTENNSYPVNGAFGIARFSVDQ